jgi:hypothetical protein
MAPNVQKDTFDALFAVGSEVRTGEAVPVADSSRMDWTPDLMTQARAFRYGQRVYQIGYKKWMKSIDRRGTTEAMKAEGPEKRWQKIRPVDRPRTWT